MPEITRDQVKVPADVSADARETYIDNYMAATRGTGRLMLFACDQKVEHLNGDFYGEGIDPADLDPEHLFKIASEGVCGVCAGQRGLVARYAADYPEVNYLVKMNSKTNLVKTAQDDPCSPQLHDLEAVLDMRANGVNVVGLGYTIYLGSEYESTMLAEAGQLIAEAHAAGLLVVLWIYPRGKAVADEKARPHRWRRWRRAVPGRRLREGKPAEGHRRSRLRREPRDRFRCRWPYGPCVRWRFHRRRRDLPHAAA